MQDTISLVTKSLPHRVIVEARCYSDCIIFLYRFDPEWSNDSVKFHTTKMPQKDIFALVLILCSSALFGSTQQVQGRLSNLAVTPTLQEFDVTRFGAVGDGKTDDTKAFQSTWEAACKKQSNNAKIVVPAGKTFYVNAVLFQGPCKPPSIKYQILGRIVAAPRSAWRRNGVNIWIYFLQVNGLSVDGNGQGQIDGLGQEWWKHMNEGARPTAMRFSQCNKLELKGLKYLNSQQNHLSIHACDDSVISNLEMRAPEDSPNTDGIDISSSTNVHIHHCNIATGDDCIAINEATSDVTISDIACGPGHGISIGSLGKSGKHDEVQRINVTNCSFSKTQNGVRIKTYQGGSGFVRSVNFTNITFIEAGNPVIIDQYYCPHSVCSNKSSAIEVSDVRFSGLRGTSTTVQATINLSCSQTVPCKNIVLNDVNIKSANPPSSTSAVCVNAHGQAHTLSPVVNCLQR